MTTTMIFRKGDIICKEGEYVLNMFEIISGSASVYMKYGTPEERKLAEVNNGFIGEMGLIESKPRIATVIADEDTKVRVIDEKDFITYFNEDPANLKKLILCLSRHQNAANELYMDACAEMRNCLADDEKNMTFNRKIVRFLKGFGGHTKMAI